MAAGLIYVGIVTDLSDDGPYVRIPQLAPVASFGPITPCLVAGLEVGERVAVGTLGSGANAFIVLGRMAGRWPELAEIPGLDARLDAIEAVNVAEDGRLTAAEGVNVTQNGRLTTVEAAAAGNTTAVTQLRADTAGKVTAKGDLLAGTGAGVLARVGAGTDNVSALVPDSTQSVGVAWKTPLALPQALTGAIAAGRYVGQTATSAAPVAGAFLVGDWVRDANGLTWVCTVAGSPGTWISGANSRLTSAESRLTTDEASITANGAAITQLRADTAGKVTTKGDLLVATASGVVARHGVPADGLLLVPDSTAADGWASKDVLGMPKALTGAVAATRYVGASASGPPTTGTFAVGDYVILIGTAATGRQGIALCTVAGTPGTWAALDINTPRVQVKQGADIGVGSGVAGAAAITASTNYFATTTVGVNGAGAWAVDGTDPFAIFTSGAPHSLTIPAGWGGRWLFMLHLEVDASAVNDDCVIMLARNAAAVGSSIERITGKHSATEGAVMTGHREMVVAAADKIYWGCWASTAFNIKAARFGDSAGRITARYLSPT